MQVTEKSTLGSWQIRILKDWILVWNWGCRVNWKRLTRLIRYERSQIDILLVIILNCNNSRNPGLQKLRDENQNIGHNSKVTTLSLHARNFYMTEPLKNSGSGSTILPISPDGNKKNRMIPKSWLNYVTWYTLKSPNLTKTFLEEGWMKQRTQSPDLESPCKVHMLGHSPA